MIKDALVCLFRALFARVDTGQRYHENRDQAVSVETCGRRWRQLH